MHSRILKHLHTHQPSCSLAKLRSNPSGTLHSNMIRWNRTDFERRSESYQDHGRSSNSEMDHMYSHAIASCKQAAKQNFRKNTQLPPMPPTSITEAAKTTCFLFPRQVPMREGQHVCLGGVGQPRSTEAVHANVGPLSERRCC